MPFLRRARGRLRLLTSVVVGYWLLLFVSNHIPASAVPNIGHYDKVVHFLEYAGLAFLISWVVANNTPLKTRTYFVIFGVIAVYGICDELLQMLPMIRRSADVKDWLADMVGAIAGLVVFALFTKLAKKKSPSSN